MKFAQLCDDATAQALGTAWLLRELAPASEYGRRELEALTPFRPGEESAAQARAQRISELAQACEGARLDALRAAFGSAPDADGTIVRASMGSAPDDPESLELLRALDAMARVDALVDGVLAPCGNEVTATLARDLERGRSGTVAFYLDDAFDLKLREVRDAAGRAQADFDAAHGRLVAQIAAALGRERIDGDEFILMREDLRGGLPQHVRVVREAPTYLLCELDLDDALLALLARRDAAGDAVAQAEETVRERLAARIRESASELEGALSRFGQLDLLVTQARFARRHACSVPEILNHPRLEFRSGRFLALQAELEADARSYVPIDVELDDLAVLTGPNMGGKSVCLRTCGLIALLAAFGMPVPAESARVALFDELVWLGIGAEGEQGGLLSAFAREVLRLRDVLARPLARPLVLIDEFARTTNPAEGTAIVVATIGRLRARGAVGLVATHLDGVAAAAGVTHYAVRGLRNAPKRVIGGDLSAALAALAQAMDYSIGAVESAAEEHADAIALAELLGVEPQLVAAARSALAKNGKAANCSSSAKTTSQISE